MTGAVVTEPNVRAAISFGVLISFSDVDDASAAGHVARRDSLR
jgi:hypothetical protein